MRPFRSPFSMCLAAVLLAPAAARALVREGKTLEQVQAARPSAEFDARWGQGFMKPASFVRVVYESVARR